MASLFNRELSWLEYNRRILGKARDEGVPLLERLRFLTYCSNNLDEFFMTRAGRVRDQIDAGVVTRSPDGLTPGEEMQLIRMEAHQFIADVYECLGSEVLPSLQRHGIVIESFRKLPPTEQESTSDFFRREIAPVLTPRAVDPGHPFPFVANRTLNIAATVESAGGEHVVLMKVPPSLPHFIALPGAVRLLPIGSLITANLRHFFPSLRVLRTVLFRVIRSSEVNVDDDALDLRESIEAALRLRERKPVVCLEIDARADESVIQLLREGTGCEAADVYPVSGFLKIGDLAEVCERVGDETLRYPSFNPRLPPRLASNEDIFSIIRRGDVLLHRPYDSFAPVIELLHAAATDPAVVAITQTLYQTDEHSPIAEKLIIAAQNDKQVSAVVELQARFEESKNIDIARRLRDAGVQVVYGIAGLKTHCKLTLAVRREENGLRRYLHVSTGNYAVDAARGYTDLDLLTADPAFGEDAARLLNLLTGYSAASLADIREAGSDRPRFERFVVSPIDYFGWLTAMIERESGHARRGAPARIVAKLNALEDPKLIAMLYEASRAGVAIDLVVRGICCLIPGVPGMSENIRVISVVDRFLEHSRILYFGNGGADEVYLSSGDWMPRNFHHRIELTFPILDAELKQRVLGQILGLTLADNISSWQLQSDGRWQRRTSNGQEPVDSQELFIRLARAEAISVGPLQETIASPATFRRRSKRRRSASASR
jgi:polyphosphate kinase